MQQESLMSTNNDPSPLAQVVARMGSRRLVTIRGIDDFMAPAVIYDMATESWSPPQPLGSWAKFMPYLEEVIPYPLAVPPEVYLQLR